MSVETYQQRGLETETPIFDILHWLGVEKITEDGHLTSRKIRLIHSALGVSSDLQELLTAKSQAHQREELGDVFWYAMLGVDALGLNFEQLMRPVLAELENGSPRVFNIIQRGRHDVERTIHFVQKNLQEWVTIYEDRVKAYVFYCSPVVKATDGSGAKIPAEEVLGTALERILEWLVIHSVLVTDTPVSEILEANIRKLETRHKNKKPSEVAVDRDKRAEYAAMGENPDHAQS